ncbi:MAG: hypothetical protein ACRDP5_03970, partial [Streptosporangiaceae bacterium]
AAWNAGPTDLVIKVSRDPAENTSTSPLGKALAELEGVELEDAELEDVALDEELLLHPAASAVQAMASRATRGALSLANRGIIPRTLPLLVARRKEQGHAVRGWL